MSDVTAPGRRKTDAEMIRELEEIVAEMAASQERMQSRQANIDRLRSETREIAARTAQKLDEIERTLSQCRRWPEH